MLARQNWPKRQKCQIYERLKFKTATREGYRDSGDKVGLVGRARQTLLDQGGCSWLHQSVARGLCKVSSLLLGEKHKPQKVSAQCTAKQSQRKRNRKRKREGEWKNEAEKWISSVANFLRACCCGHLQHTHTHRNREKVTHILHYTKCKQLYLTSPPAFSFSPLHTDPTLFLSVKR